MNPITLRVQVTATDIACGKPESCFACPVARAINRAAATYRLGGATSRRAAGQDELQAKRLAKEAEKRRADQQKRCKRKSAERRSPTGRNLEIIETLKDQGPLCSRDLARAMGVPVAVVAQRINQLERDRHVQGGPSRQSGTWVWSVTEAKKEAS